MSSAELATIESKAQELQELTRMQEELTAEIEALKDFIKTAMGDAEQITAGPFKITWKAITSSRLDTKALKAALPDVAQRFTTTTTARRFTIN